MDNYWALPLGVLSLIMLGFIHWDLCAIALALQTIAGAK